MIGFFKILAFPFVMGFKMVEELFYTGKEAITEKSSIVSKPQLIIIKLSLLERMV